MAWAWSTDAPSAQRDLLSLSTSAWLNIFHICIILGELLSEAVGWLATCVPLSSQARLQNHTSMVLQDGLVHCMPYGAWLMWRCTHMRISYSLADGLLGQTEWPLICPGISRGSCVSHTAAVLCCDVVRHPLVMIGRQAAYCNVASIHGCFCYGKLKASLQLSRL
jgi:hypothetical protein